jgi:hypothetical protein
LGGITLVGEDFMKTQKLISEGATSPSSPPSYAGPPLAIDGTLLPLVPFELSLFPSELRVQADRQSGLFSGDFEVGVLIKPGPTQHRSAEVTDLVRLHVTGDPQVQFFSQLPYESLPAPFHVEITPTNWDLKTGYMYDLTCEIYITNNNYSDQIIFLMVNVINLDQEHQVLAVTEKSSINVRSGTTEVVLLALLVSASVSSRSDIKVIAIAGDSELESHVMVNCDPDAQIPEYYQITTPSTLNIVQGVGFSLQFTTTGGEEGPVTWTVDDPMFLSEHGMRFTSDGILKSDGDVLGPAVKRNLIFMARKETGLLTRMYASKIIGLIII